jgi:transposase
MQEYLWAQQGWLTVERLPGYAPDLNPVETMWGNIKGQAQLLDWRRAAPSDGARKCYDRTGQPRVSNRILHYG